MHISRTDSHVTRSVLHSALVFFVVAVIVVAFAADAIGRKHKRQPPVIDRKEKIECEFRDSYVNVMSAGFAARLKAVVTEFEASGEIEKSIEKLVDLSPEGFEFEAAIEAICVLYLAGLVPKNLYDQRVKQLTCLWAAYLAKVGNAGPIESCAIDQPVTVLLMDGAIVYNDSRKNGEFGTNTTDLRKTIRGVLLGNRPIVVKSEHTHLRWEGGQDIAADPPDYIIVHNSAFELGTRTLTEANELLKRFLRDMRGTSTRFLIYSRAGSMEGSDDCTYWKRRISYEKLLGDASSSRKRLRFVKIHSHQEGEFPDFNTRDHLRVHLKKLYIGEIQIPTRGTPSEDKCN